MLHFRAWFLVTACLLSVVSAKAPAAGSGPPAVQDGKLVLKPLIEGKTTPTGRQPRSSLRSTP
jgi:hypothetical protein